MKKILVFIGSRSTYGRLKSVCKAIHNHPALELQLIAACSAYNLPMDYEPNYRIQALISGDDTEAMAITTGVLLTKITDALKALKPDIVFLHGDRYEIIACAVAAAYMNIPICHSEGGEDTGTIDQKVRYVITVLADIHFPVTEKAADRIRAITKDNIYVVGSTALDTIVNIDPTNNRTEPYIVILHHPNTTDPEDITPMLEALDCIPYKKVWVNPNVDAGSKTMLKLIHKLNVEFVKNLPPEEYARLIYNSMCCVGNSSSFIKECAFFGIPSVVIGGRQQNREHGNNVIFIGYDADLIYEAILKQINHGRYKKDYRFGDGTAAKKIVEVLSS